MITNSGLQVDVTRTPVSIRELNGRVWEEYFAQGLLNNTVITTLKIYRVIEPGKKDPYYFDMDAGFVKPKIARRDTLAEFQGRGYSAQLIVATNDFFKPDFKIGLYSDTRFNSGNINGRIWSGKRAWERLEQEGRATYAPHKENGLVLDRWKMN